MAVDQVRSGRTRKNYGRGMSRGFRRIRRSFGRSALRLFHLDDLFRSGIRQRMLDKNIEDGYRDLGEFIYARLQDETLEEGDLILLDLMRTELARLVEEKKAVSSQGKLV